MASDFYVGLRNSTDTDNCEWKASSEKGHHHHHHHHSRRRRRHRLLPRHSFLLTERWLQRWKHNCDQNRTLLVVLVAAAAGFSQCTQSKSIISDVTDSAGRHSASRLPAQRLVMLSACTRTSTWRRRDEQLAAGEGQRWRWRTTIKYSGRRQCRAGGQSFWRRRWKWRKRRSHAHRSTACKVCNADDILGSGIDPISLLTNRLVVLLVVDLVLVVATLIKKAQGSVVLNRIGMKFGKNGLQMNTHRLR